MQQYDNRQLTELTRKINGIQAFKILKVDSDGLHFNGSLGENLICKPLDLLINEYKAGQYFDLMVNKINGRITSFQFVGETPALFIPEK